MKSRLLQFIRQLFLLPRMAKLSSENNWILVWSRVCSYLYMPVSSWQWTRSFPDRLGFFGIGNHFHRCLQRSDDFSLTHAKVVA